MEKVEVHGAVLALQKTVLSGFLPCELRSGLNLKLF